MDSAAVLARKPQTNDLSNEQIGAVSVDDAAVNTGQLKC